MADYLFEISSIPSMEKYQEVFGHVKVAEFKCPRPPVVNASIFINVKFRKKWKRYKPQFNG